MYFSGSSFSVYYLLVATYRGVFKTQLNNYHGLFSKNSWWLLALNYFCKRNLSQSFSAGFGWKKTFRLFKIRFWLSKILATEFLEKNNAICTGYMFFTLIKALDLIFEWKSNIQNCSNKKHRLKFNYRSKCKNVLKLILS